MYHELLNEICVDNEIKCETFSHKWVYRLTKNGKTRFVAGHHFDGNSSAADRIACDKYACYEVLESKKIPAVVHKIIFDPVTRPGWMGEKGTWQTALELYRTFGQKVVIKPNDGWQGRNVSLCETPAEVEQALQAIFFQDANACMCPFYELEHEYRVFYTFGECSYAYGKKRSPGSWKHNLSGGATAFEIEDEALLASLYDLSKRAAEAININFATVDIVQQAKDGKLMVIEINAGVSAKRLLEQRPENRAKIKASYEKAVLKMFE
jgi:glutathione synthase/RimK-type ligase-like ATP-grasp enzyme